MNSNVTVQPDKVAPNSIQPDLECFQGWDAIRNPEVWSHCPCQWWRLHSSPFSIWSLRHCFLLTGCSHPANSLSIFKVLTLLFASPISQRNANSTSVWSLQSRQPPVSSLISSFVLICFLWSSSALLWDWFVFKFVVENLPVLQNYFWGGIRLLGHLLIGRFLFDYCFYADCLIFISFHRWCIWHSSLLWCI